MAVSIAAPGFTCVSGNVPQDGGKLSIRPGDSVVFVGDSISDFAVIDAFANLRAMVDAFYTARRLTPPTWVDQAVTGDTTQGVINRITDITVLDLDVVFLYIGINDVQASVANATIAANLTTIVDAIFAARPTVRMMLLCPWLIFGVKPNGSNAEDSDLNTVRASVQALAAARGIPFVDIRTLYFNSTETALLADSVHPNAAGKVWLCQQVAFRLNLRETP